MKQIIRPTDEEIKIRMGIDGECFFKIEDRDDGYYRIVIINPEDVTNESSKTM